MFNFLTKFFKRKSKPSNIDLEKAKELGFITEQEKLELEIERAKGKLAEFLKKKKK